MLRPVFRIQICLLASALVISSNQAAAETAANCLNPNQNAGQCISIYDCNSLSFVLRKHLSAQYRFVRLSQCDGGADASGKFPFVCCNNDTDFRDPNADWQQRIIFPGPDNSGRPGPGRKNVALIEPPRCGALTISNKIFGGEEAEITEFTWMVKLEYKTVANTFVSECAGSLINERYVLTAAHCVIGPIEEKIGKLVSLRVGDHDTESPQICNQKECWPPYQRFGIESVVVHERYLADQNLHINEHNDIALIRMDRSVEFNDYIEPVCLPTASLQQELKKGQLLTVAGWGHTGLSKHSRTKRKTRLPLYDMEECRHVYQKFLYVADEQFCAGGVHNQDACYGDSGGPLMRLNSTSWVIEGIVSFGRSCGLENRPGIYTRVRNYIDWIAEHMDPW